MIKNIRVGIPIVGRKEWSGGISYIELLVKAVSSLPTNQRPKLFLVVTDHTLADYELHKYFISFFDGIIFVGENQQEAEIIIQQPFIKCFYKEDLLDKIDFYFPDIFNDFPYSCSAAWITDFQHRYFAELFSQEEYNSLENRYREMANNRSIIVFSSHNAEKDFKKFYPESKALTHVLSFFALPQAEWYQSNPVDVHQKYSLPDYFLLCCNQFMAYKNHRRLFEAIAYLRERGKDIPVVCTGMTYDYRVPQYFPQLEQYIEQLGIKDLVKILGLVPRADQIQIIRRSMAVVQPTLFEGWSTVVEDSRVLGKTIFLSDLPVNIEQNPDYAIYFDRHDSHDLAKKILKQLPELSAGPDDVREDKARKKSFQFAEAYAREFCSLVSKIQNLLAGYQKNSVSDTSVFIIYDPKGHAPEKSVTYRSLKEQNHNNLKVYVGSLDEVDFSTIIEDYIYYIEEGFIINKNFIQLMITAGAKEDVLVCKLKRTLNSGKTFFNDTYPISEVDINLYTDEVMRPCILYRRKSFTKEQVLNYAFEGKNISFINMAPVKITLSNYIRKRLGFYKDKNIYIYGAGGHTESLLANVKLDDYNICGIIDKNESLHGKRLFGYKVFDLEHLKEMQVGCVLISSASYEKEIYSQLQNYIEPQKLLRIHYQ